MVKRFSPVWMTAVLIWTSSAFAQQQDPREIQARKDCLTGKYESGVALLAELFVETGNANFIYNQARCYEQNARPEDAINRFREYLRVAKDISQADKTGVEHHIAECRELQAEQQKRLLLASPPSPAASAASASQRTAQSTAAAPSPSPASAASGAAPPPAPAQSGTGAAAVSDTAKQAQNARGSGLRITGRVILGVGLAAAATGVVFSLLVSNAKQQMESNADKKIYDSALDSRGRTYDTWQWVSYGTGAGLLVVGVILRIVDFAAARQAALSVALVPSIGPGQGGLALQGSF